MKKPYDSFIGGRNFKEEFRRQLRLLVIASLGFTIVFSWRQTIFDAAERLINYFFNPVSAFFSSILASAFITFFSPIIIWVTSHFLK